MDVTADFGKAAAISAKFMDYSSYQGRKAGKGQADFHAKTRRREIKGGNGATGIGCLWQVLRTHGFAVPLLRFAPSNFVRT